MSCQHLPCRRIFKFLVHQCWKLVKICYLAVSFSFLLPLFQDVHGINLAFAETWLDCPSRYTFTLTMVLRISFSHNYLFFSIPVYVRVAIKFCWNLRKLWFLVIFFKQKFENLCFSLKCFPISLQCNAENTELKSEQPVMRYMFQTFSIWVFTMEAALGGF